MKDWYNTEKKDVMVLGEAMTRESKEENIIQEEKIDER